MPAWALTAEALERLLAVLDESREVAGEKYEHVRRALLVYFRSRQCPSPEDLADDTINRVARRVAEGQEIWTSNPQSYFLGVARNVLREQWDKPKREGADISELPPSQQPKFDPAERSRSKLEAAGREKRLDCLDGCVDELFPHQRDLLLEYYSEERREKIDARIAVADRLGIPLNALRIRMCRMRQKLQQCVEQCLVK
jgi:DNA-directed RNA polymerase specialized sigma24 family protein